MKFNLGLKIGSKDTKYTDEILRFYEQGIFQYIELFTLTGTYEDTISYWKQFNISFGIHAPHSSVANGWIYLGKVRIDGYKKSTKYSIDRR